MDWKIIMTLLLATSLIPALSADTMKIYPSDDVFVMAGSYSNTNFQTYQSGDWSDRLKVGYEGSFDRARSLLKFDLSNLTGKSVTAITLSLKKGPISVGVPNIQLYNFSDIAWTENAATWNSVYSYPKSLITSVAVGSGVNRLNFNVLAYSLNKSKVSFELIESSDGTGVQNAVYFFSKDYDTGDISDSEYWPYLEVTYTGGPCTTTADTSGDGKINMNELLAYIAKWKSGTVTMNSLLQGIGYWKAGAGC